MTHKERPRAGNLNYDATEEPDTSYTAVLGRDSINIYFAAHLKALSQGTHFGKQKARETK